MATELLVKEKYRPGHLDLGLNAASVHGQYQIDRNIAMVDKILRDFRCSECRLKTDPLDRCNTCKYDVTCCAILNLKGAFYYYKKQYLNACNEFEKVLKIDKVNTNAFCNLHHVYIKLGDWERAKQYDHPYKTCSGGNKDKRNDSNKETNVMDEEQKKANYLGEQGFAIMFDCHTKVNELQRYQRAVAIFKECLDISKELLKKTKYKESLEIDVLQWKLWYAQSLHRMSNTCPNSNDCYTEGTKTLIEVKDAPIAKRHNHIISIAYTYLGNFQSKKIQNSSAAKDTEPSGPSAKNTEIPDPDHCFSMALDFQRNTEALIRNAIHLKVKDVCKAIEFVQEALDLDQSDDGNWFAWSVSSDLHVLHVENYKSDKNPELLDIAIRHGEIASSANQTTNLFVTLGKAYHYKARDHTRDQVKKHNLFLKALECFFHALQHLDGDKHDSVHIAHGNCLLDMGQHRPALESFKRAVELGLDTRKNILSSYIAMMKCYMTILSKEKKLKERKDLLETILYWLHLGDKNENLLKESSPESNKMSTTEKNERGQRDVCSNEICNQRKDPQNKKQHGSMSVTSFHDVHISRERENNVDIPNMQNDAKQRKKCICENPQVERKICCKNEEDKHQGWQTSCTDALISLIKFILQTKGENQDKLIRMCLSLETNLNAFPHIVLDILLQIVSFKKETLIEDCLGHLNDHSDQIFCSMNESRRSWYVSEMSKRLLELQCKICQNSKTWEEICRHELNPASLYSAIAKYCPSFAREIADHMMTCNVKLTQILLEDFHNNYISHDDINEQVLKQHLMVCVSDLHYQACWLRTERRSVNNESKHNKMYKKGFHPQYHKYLNRSVSLELDCTHIITDLLRMSTVDEDSHMKLVKCHEKYDTIYLRYYRKKSESTSPCNIFKSDKQPRNRKCNYDFFVINSRIDNDMVKFELLPTLEGRYGFKGCFALRDYMPGETIFQQFEEKLQECSKVLLVLTENFKKDRECCFQMHSALMKKLCTDRHKLIPLVAVSGDDKTICDQVIPEEIQHIVCFSVYRFNWEKLVRALEEE